MLPAHLSKVTDIISANNALRFCTEYLGIDGNEFNIIQHNSKYNHHDTVYACLEQWKNKIEAEGKDAPFRLDIILTTIQHSHGWFSQDDIADIFKEEPGIMSKQRKGAFINYGLGWVGDLATGIP